MTAVALPDVVTGPDGARVAVRVGCDVVDVAGLSARLDRTPSLLDRLFTPREVNDARRGGATPGSDVERRRLAARVAAKEAAYKALGLPGLAFRDVEVRTGPDGAPALWVRGAPHHASVSLSHDGPVAMAVVAVATAASDAVPVGPAASDAVAVATTPSQGEPNAAQ